jgi:serine phosphatase RsbU (regulator of sigma subunit)/anti-sigma regulatory factor (Ser/Thr protein kinase)
VFFETAEDLRDEFPDLHTAADHESYLYVPLVAGRRANALLVLSWSEPYALTQDERRFVEALAGQAAQALDRATHFESEQTIAETLQRSVLPVTLPRVEEIQLAARYLPGTAELDVGGDWFDAIPLPDGRLGLVVGDVVGKGVQAASTMAQLRNALRAFSLDRMKPSSTIARLNRLAEEVVETAFATIVYAVVDPAAGVCRITSAGHPPMLIAYPDRRVELVEGGRGLPLGAGPDTRYRQAVVELPVGSVLLLYSDGLVERRGRTIDEGLEELKRAAGDGPREPEQLVEHILDRMVGEEERGDDIALLAARLLAVAPRPLRLRVPSDTDSLDLVRDVVRAWLAGAQLDRSDAHDIVLAVWEACANAIEHAVEPDGNHVAVRADVLDGRLRISVEDTGGWLPPTERENRGLGLRLIYESMSSVDVVPGQAGTRVTFEKILAEVGEPA